jgi:hypothetical protein
MCFRITTRAREQVAQILLCSRIAWRNRLAAEREIVKNQQSDVRNVGYCNSSAYFEQFLMRKPRGQP